MMDFPLLLVTLRKIDQSGLKTRDVVVLEAIRQNPGVMGRTLALKMGYHDRSMVQDAIKRTLRLGFAEDRRIKEDQRTPNILHITPAGVKFLDELIPQYDM